MTQLPPGRHGGTDQPYPSATQPGAAQAGARGGSAPPSRRELRELEQQRAAAAEAERRRIAELEERRAEAEWRAEQERQAEAEWRAEQERQAEAEWRAEQERQAEAEWRAEQERQAEAEWRAEQERQAQAEWRAEQERQAEAEWRAEQERQAQAEWRAEQERLAHEQRAARGAVPDERAPWEEPVVEGEERVRAADGRRPAARQGDPATDASDLFAPWDDDPAPRPSRADRRAAAADEVDEHGRPRRRRGRRAMGCLVALLVLVAIGAGAWFFFLQAPVAAFLERFEPPADYSGSGSGEVVFMINEGDGGVTIASNLEDEGVVASAEAFIDEVTSRSPHPTFYPGAYRLASEMSAKSALDALLDPANKLENTFVIQEGLWARDALAAASAATGIPLEELQAAAADPQALGLPAQATSVEGFLFPATYTFPPDVTAQQVVKTLVDRTFQALDEAGVPAEQRWETIVVASLIERESGSEEDSYKVSRVIKNRLDPALFESGLLQFDSTVHYGLGDDSTVETSDAERADASNPYNTYVHPGLPPGPIGNPGDVAIDAALHPADGPWLYFVTVNLETGETVFSATLEEHEAAVQRFLQYLEDNG
ncbi:endolytic transglycosylase MltG [Agromyces aurantiacus]|uniref:Endolytic murein transglycosylase n=1 Tax=Agromyces aurantiacus TaxID=165814 RepID=A0ABV9R7R0_9MICO